jgi:hypothetical protein
MRPFRRDSAFDPSLPSAAKFAVKHNIALVRRYGRIGAALGR